MRSTLCDESADLIKLLTKKMIDFQPSGRIGKLHNQLRRATVRGDDTNVNVVLFDLEEANRKFDASSPLEVEARVTDVGGNPLHAIVYLDKSGNLLALEVFPWDEWTGGIDIASLAPTTYDDQGLSKPE